LKVGKLVRVAIVNEGMVFGTEPGVFVLKDQAGIQGESGLGLDRAGNFDTMGSRIQQWMAGERPLNRLPYRQLLLRESGEADQEGDVDSAHSLSL
jgi:hypothetical protein